MSVMVVCTLNSPFLAFISRVFRTSAGCVAAVATKPYWKKVDSKEQLWRVPVLKRVTHRHEARCKMCDNCVVKVPGEKETNQDFIEYQFDNHTLKITLSAVKFALFGRRWQPGMWSSE